MKCIHCSADSKYKARGDGRCPYCKRRFAFEPRNGDPLTDSAFEAAIDCVSAKDSLFFNTAHLYYEVCRRIARKNRFGELFMAFSLFFLFASGFASFVTQRHLWLIPAPFFALGVYLKSHPIRFKTVRLSREKFDQLLEKWRSAHGVIGKLITRVKMPPLPKAVAKDLGEYSFDRAVICDRPGTVDLLVANKFHFENNCAVLSANGYPEPIFQLVKQMLQRNPRLEVYVLHDATAAGCRLAHELANSPDWFHPNARIIDVGLRPKHVESLSGLWLLANQRELEDSAISKAEAKWLSRYRLELAAVRPEQLLKRLYKAITKRIKEERDGGGDVGSIALTTGSESTSTDEPHHGVQDSDSLSAEADADGDAGTDGFG